jgi:hypothetical protein
MIAPRRRPSPGALLLLSAASVALVCACSARAPELSTPTRTAERPAVQFSYEVSYEALDGTVLSTESLSKRVTVIGLLTTYDVLSQVVARFLASLARSHTPRLNVAALMLEDAENKPLVEAFVASLGLPYPVALADAATITGEGPFAGLHHVPSVVILDKEGREAWRHVGFVDQARLEAAVKAVEQGR